MLERKGTAGGSAALEHEFHALQLLQLSAQVRSIPNGLEQREREFATKGSGRLRGSLGLVVETIDTRRQHVLDGLRHAAIAPAALMEHRLRQLFQEERVAVAARNDRLRNVFVDRTGK